jgi:hypothetical protein
MRLPDMNNLGRVIKGAVTALGCLIFAMMFFAGVIALSDYSVAQSHNQPGAAEGATLAEVITLLAFGGGAPSWCGTSEGGSSAPLPGVSRGRQVGG